VIWWKQIINGISVVTADSKTKVWFIFHFVTRTQFMQDSQCTYKHHIEAHSHNHCCCG